MNFDRNEHAPKNKLERGIPPVKSEEHVAYASAKSALDLHSTIPEK